MSQPYIYTVFTDKKALFLQGQSRVVDHIRQTFRAAAGDRHGEDALELPEAYLPPHPRSLSRRGSSMR